MEGSFFIHTDLKQLCLNEIDPETKVQIMPHLLTHAW